MHSCFINLYFFFSFVIIPSREFEELSYNKYLAKEHCDKHPEDLLNASSLVVADISICMSPNEIAVDTRSDDHLEKSNPSGDEVNLDTNQNSGPDTNQTDTRRFEIKEDEDAHDIETRPTSTPPPLVAGAGVGVVASAITHHPVSPVVDDVDVEPIHSGAAQYAQYGKKNIEQMGTYLSVHRVS